ncbi:MAG: L,D-transpeptidase family protein [Phycisphaeraceae bacterium]|nr:L,D-transpeptidase family protein [Phycisphaeraceae bacterium]MBX3405437.1 L,D-transpeptidase family protein [Phycisphaeraceae bacterium]
MALASQMSRGQRVPSSSVAAYRSKRRARMLKGAGIAALVVLCGTGLLYILHGRDSGPRSANAQPVNDPLKPADAAAGAPAASPAPANSKPPEARPEPALISMNSMRDGARAPTSAQSQPRTDNGLTASPGSGVVRDPLVTNPAASGAPDRMDLPEDLASLVSSAERAQREGKLADARASLNRVLLDRRTPESERGALRRWISDLNETLLFSPTVVAGDPFAQSYTVVGGDSLPVINRKLGLTTEFLLIARLNKLADPSKIQIGQRLKVVNGPFHAVVSKSAYRMDIFAGDPPSPSSIGTSLLACGAEPGWVYIRSFPVGLGAEDGTPIANFVVRPNSKLVNPEWRNPRTGERFAANDPRNPIGERWIGLDGLDEASRGHTGFGIHGTIEPESIGRSMSMGCIRLGDRDVEIVYELLAPRVSVVKVVP